MQLLAAQFLKQTKAGNGTMQTSEIGQEIRSYLVGTFLFGHNEKLQDDEPLLGNVIDSTGVVELVVFLQERFAITIEDDEVTAENLGSVRSVGAFIERKVLNKG
jgi:acyl carrier protein